MAKRKTDKPAPKRHAVVPFKNIPITTHHDEMPKHADPMPPAPHKYDVEVRVTDVGETFWQGHFFVSLEACDGQDLKELVRTGQRLFISCLSEKGD